MTRRTGISRCYGPSWRTRLPRWLVTGFVCAASAACIQRNRVNADCAWTNDRARTLNLAIRADDQHLAMDAAVAEDLAIRHADALRGLRSGHFAGHEDYRRTRERCMAQLIAIIAIGHAVQPQDVSAAVGRRPAGFDGAVLLSFAGVYALLARMLAGAMTRRFPPDQPTPALVAAAAVSVFASATGLMIFALWAGVAEMVRLGNQHLSYRAGRVPWQHDVSGLFVLGVVLFWTFAVIEQRRARRTSLIK
jgi:hypothetical protein